VKQRSRRRRRAKKNPVTPEAGLIVGGIGGALSAVLGQPQLGGAVLLGSGTYALVKGSATQKLLGGIYDLLGLGMVFVRR
jgi:hypothetical protein